MADDSMVWLLIECDGAENWNWIFKNDYNDDDDEGIFFLVGWFNGCLRMNVYEVHMTKVAPTITKKYTHAHTRSREWKRRIKRKKDVRVVENGIGFTNKFQRELNNK